MKPSELTPRQGAQWSWPPGHPQGSSPFGDASLANWTPRLVPCPEVSHLWLPPAELLAPRGSCCAKRVIQEAVPSPGKATEHVMAAFPGVSAGGDLRGVSSICRGICLSRTVPPWRGRMRPGTGPLHVGCPCYSYNNDSCHHHHYPHDSP